LVAEKVIGRKFDITEYGVCFIEDVLDDIPESAVQVSHRYSSKLPFLFFVVFVWAAHSLKNQ